MHQVILLYSRQAGGFRPAASTLPTDDPVFAGSQLTILADAAYRNQDAHVGSSFCYARTPDDRGMILHRFPDGDTDRLSAATHVLIGDKVAAGMALGLASGWPHWWRGGPWGELYPLDRDHLLEQAQEQLRRQQHTARSRTIEEELTRLIVALVDVGSAPLAITGHTHDPALLLIAARDILRDWASPDWSFSTGEPVQHSGVRITFLLPDGQPHSDGYADLASYPQHSPQLITIANLVRAYTNSPDPATWSTLLEKAGINTLDDLLSWAEGFTPTPGTEDLRRTLNDNHNQQITALKATAQSAQDALQHEIFELTEQRDGAARASVTLQKQWTSARNQWTEIREVLETENQQAAARLAELEQRALSAEQQNDHLSAENDSLRDDVSRMQDQLVTAPPPASAPAGRAGLIHPDPDATVGTLPGSHTGPFTLPRAAVAQPHVTGDNENGDDHLPVQPLDRLQLILVGVAYILLILVAFLSETR
ncbi:hypothetical protein MXD59_25015 [Frankia sp. Ag45/Mut15]|uniref:Chromosome segregation ATPase-like protein n=1 Tax=Frankia umida TaxID=573489 RepID=A0ABT0K5C4_9ACTN|nr:hypothetical protein [Frankia umida]MCK9878980.1 hypothetical protein [Frankia umida]